MPNVRNGSKTDISNLSMTFELGAVIVHPGLTAAVGGSWAPAFAGEQDQSIDFSLYRLSINRP